MVLISCKKCGIDYTSTYKPVVLDPTGKLFRMAGWPGGNGSAPLKFSQTATVVVNGTTAETSLVRTGTGTITITANTITAGKTYRVKVHQVAWIKPIYVASTKYLEKTPGGELRHQSFKGQG